MQNEVCQVADLLQNLNLNDFSINFEAIKQAYLFKKAHDPAFKSLSVAALADRIGIGESTLKRILHGQAADLHASTLWAICKVLGLDPAVVLNLAPERDYAREADTYNPTLMDNLRRQIYAQDERLQSRNEKIADLEKEQSEFEARENALQEKIYTLVSDLSAMTERHRAAHENAAQQQRRARVFSAASAVFALSTAVLFTLRLI